MVVDIRPVHRHRPATRRFSNLKTEPQFATITIGVYETTPDVGCLGLSQQARAARTPPVEPKFRRHNRIVSRGNLIVGYMDDR